MHLSCWLSGCFLLLSIFASKLPTVQAFMIARRTPSLLHQPTVQSTSKWAVYSKSSYDDFKTMKSMVDTADALLIVPATCMNMNDELKFLQKMMTSYSFQMGKESRMNLVNALDGTPFCQICPEYLYPSNYIIFLKGSGTVPREFAQKWIQSLSKNPIDDPYAMILCTKLYCARINISA
jgi:hypothetical protein